MKRYVYKVIFLAIIFYQVISRLSVTDIIRFLFHVVLLWGPGKAATCPHTGDICHFWGCHCNFGDNTKSSSKIPAGFCRRNYGRAKFWVSLQMYATPFYSMGPLPGSKSRSQKIFSVDLQGEDISLVWMGAIFHHLVSGVILLCTSVIYSPYATTQRQAIKFTSSFQHIWFLTAVRLT